MSIFVIKIIAYISMFLDHIKYAIPETRNFATIFLGRLAFPLFAFVLTEGYIHTKNLKKYYFRLIIFALVSQLPYMLFISMIENDIWQLNILFTLLLGLIAINIYDKFENKIIGILGIIICSCLGSLIKVDYGWYGVLTVAVFYLFKNKKIWLTISFLFLNFIYLISNFRWNINLVQVSHYILLTCMNLPILFVLLYNGKLGKKVNYMFYYLLYPIHMIIFFTINLIL